MERNITAENNFNNDNINHKVYNDTNERVIPSSSPIHSTMDIGDLNYVTPSRFLGTDEKIVIENTTKEYNNHNNNINNKTTSRFPLDNEPIKRTSKLLKQLNSSAFLSDVDPLLSDIEKRIEKMFNQKRFQTLFDQINKLLSNNQTTKQTKYQTTYQTVEKSGAAAAIEVDPSEPADRFVAVSRSLQSDKKLGGYSNFKEASRSRTSSHSHGPRGEQFFMETLFDSKTLLAAAALGLAFSFFPSSSPVPRTLFGRAWPHLLQLAIAAIVHIRKTQDLNSDEPRPNMGLYIATAVVQVFTAMRDIRGHSFVSFASRALFGPIAPLVGLIKQIIVAIPNFLLKTVLLSGISILGKVTIFLTISVAIVVAIGVLIVTAAEYV